MKSTNHRRLASRKGGVWKNESLSESFGSRWANKVKLFFFKTHHRLDILYLHQLSQNSYVSVTLINTRFRFFGFCFSRNRLNWRSVLWYLILIQDNERLPNKAVIREQEIRHPTSNDMLSIKSHVRWYAVNYKSMYNQIRRAMYEVLTYSTCTNVVGPFLIETYLIHFWKVYSNTLITFKINAFNYSH